MKKTWKCNERSRSINNLWPGRGFYRRHQTDFGGETESNRKKKSDRKVRTRVREGSVRVQRFSVQSRVFSSLEVFFLSRNSPFPRVQIYPFTLILLSCLWAKTLSRKFVASHEKEDTLFESQETEWRTWTKSRWRQERHVSISCCWLSLSVSSSVSSLTHWVSFTSESFRLECLVTVTRDGVNRCSISSCLVVLFILCVYLLLDTLTAVLRRDLLPKDTLFLNDTHTTSLACNMQRVVYPSSQEETKWCSTVQDRQGVEGKTRLLFIQ